MSRNYLVASRLQVSKANAISAPMTQGFPAIAAFLGVQWALNRQLTAAGIPLRANRVAVIAHQAVVCGGTNRFSQARHPLVPAGKDAFATAPFLEEGFMHMEISLIFEMQYLDETLRNDHLLDATGKASRNTALQVLGILQGLRIAGGAIMPQVPGLARSREATAFFVDPQNERAHRRLQRFLLPGFALVSRSDLVAERVAAMPEGSVFEAWLDLIRFNYRACPETSEGASSEADHHDDAIAGTRVTWRDEDRPAGYLVPIPVGYRAISRRFEPGELANARDPGVPVRFVEALYTIGQWVSPHRTPIEQLLWSAESDAEAGLYICKNDFSKKVEAAAEALINESKSDEESSEDELLSLI